MSDYDYDASDYDDNDNDSTDSADSNDSDDYSDYDYCDDSDSYTEYTDTADTSELTEDFDGIDDWEPDSIEYDSDAEEDFDTYDAYNDSEWQEMIDSENEATEEDSTDIQTDYSDEDSIDDIELTQESSDEAADTETESHTDTTGEAQEGEDITDDKVTLEINKDIDDDTDWTRTSLRSDEEALLNEMEENGEIEFLEENPDLPDPEHTALHLPSEKTGDFSGERGNSEFRPLDEEALSKMNEYGKDFVDYKDNYPDFSPFTEHDSKWGKINGQVEIGHMTDNRQNGAWEYGRRPDGTSHNPDYDIGNFAQADNAIAEELRNEFPDIKGEDIEAFRTANQLVWHECADGKTMQLVPIEIHEACKHSGGVSEMKYRMEWGDVTRPV